MEDDFKNEDNPKNEDDLKDKVDIKNKNDLKQAGAELCQAQLKLVFGLFCFR